MRNGGKGDEGMRVEAGGDLVGIGFALGARGGETEDLELVAVLVHQVQAITVDVA